MTSSASGLAHSSEHGTARVSQTTGWRRAARRLAHSSEMELARASQPLDSSLKRAQVLSLGGLSAQFSQFSTGMNFGFNCVLGENLRPKFVCYHWSNGRKRGFLCVFLHGKYYDSIQVWLCTQMSQMLDNFRGTKFLIITRHLNAEYSLRRPLVSNSTASHCSILDLGFFACFLVKHFEVIVWFATLCTSWKGYLFRLLLYVCLRLCAK